MECYNFYKTFKVSKICLLILRFNNNETKRVRKEISVKLWVIIKIVISYIFYINLLYFITKINHYNYVTLHV